MTKLLVFKVRDWQNTRDVTIFRTGINGQMNAERLQLAITYIVRSFDKVAGGRAKIALLTRDGERRAVVGSVKSRNSILCCARCYRTRRNSPLTVQFLRSFVARCPRVVIHG